MDCPPVYGTLNENQLVKAQQNQEGDNDIPFTVTIYLFLAKIRFLTSKMPNNGIPVDFTPVYGTLNESQLWRAKQNKEGDIDIPFTVSVYLFLAKNTMSLFILT